MNKNLIAAGMVSVTATAALIACGGGSGGSLAAFEAALSTPFTL